MTKIEQVVRALLAVHTGSLVDNTFAGKGVSPHEQFARFARAAVEAMVEPTERMLMECLPPRERTPIDSYRAMVRVALDESVPPPASSMG